MINNQKNKYKLYGGFSRGLVLKIHNFVMKVRKEEQLGQTNITRKIKEKFGIAFSENTISGWIHRKIVPYDQEKTQFKSKPIPSRKTLYKLYVKRGLSASKIAPKFNVSIATTIDWLKRRGIEARNHTQSMNTLSIKEELRNKRLTRPVKSYNRLTHEKAYILGVLCGDAYIDKNVTKLEIKKDIDFIKEFAKCFEEVYGIKYKYYYYPRRDSYILYVTSQIISKDLMSYGCFRTLDWKIPREILKKHNKKIAASFLRGLYDSEGSVSQYVIKLTCKNKVALEEVSALLLKMDIKNTVKHYEKYSTVWICNKPNRIKFKNKIGFIIKRKNDKL